MAKQNETTRKGRDRARTSRRRNEARTDRRKARNDFRRVVIRWQV